jgi:hypothetical protein
MPENVRTDDDNLSELRRRNLKAAELLEQWIIEDADEDDSYWPALRKELLDSAMQCREPEST